MIKPFASEERDGERIILFQSFSVSENDNNVGHSVGLGYVVCDHDDAARFRCVRVREYVRVFVCVCVRACVVCVFESMLVCVCLCVCACVRTCNGRALQGALWWDARPGRA